MVATSRPEFDFSLERICSTCSCSKENALTGEAGTTNGVPRCQGWFESLDLSSLSCQVASRPLGSCSLVRWAHLSGQIVIWPMRTYGAPISLRWDARRIVM
jgi:hypothetical protein